MATQAHRQTLNARQGIGAWAALGDQRLAGLMFFVLADAATSSERGGS